MPGIFKLIKLIASLMRKPREVYSDATKKWPDVENRLNSIQSLPLNPPCEMLIGRIVLAAGRGRS